MVLLGLRVLGVVFWDAASRGRGGDEKELNLPIDFAYLIKVVTL